MANDSIRGRQVVLRLTNKSGGGLVEGDVVIIDSTTAASVTTTTTAGLATDVIGVALETIAGDAIGRICISGYVPKINLSGAASLGDTLTTHTVAKQAAPGAARSSGAFGEVLGTGSTPAALLWGVPDGGAAGGGMATDTIWDAAGDIVQGTGSNTAGRLAIGTANQLLRVNAGATALEYASLGRVLLSNQTPTGTGVSFAAIPAGYNSLEIEFLGRGDTVAGGVFMYCWFNTDTTAANYRYSRVFFDGVSAGPSGAGGDFSYITILPAASATAGMAGYGSIQIFDYAATTFRKVAVCANAHREDATHLYTGVYSVEWESTVAITQIDLNLTAGNYVAGSRFRLYGVF